VWKTGWEWYYNGMWKDHFIATGPERASTLLNATNSLSSGHVAMGHMFQWYVCCMAPDATKPGNFKKWDIGVMPVNSAGTTTAPINLDTFTISKDSPVADRAFEAMTYVDQTYQNADAFLFGRRTYELFAAYWGVRDDLDNPIVGALNTTPKYVASNTLTEPRWADTTVLSGDLAAAIGELKARPAGELQVHGSSTLTRWLLENDLVDEMNLLIIPVVVGRGARLFPDTGPDMALDLVESRAFPKGITLQVYRPAGRPQYAAD
jgi:dihydrofolate reductase